MGIYPLCKFKIITEKWLKECVFCLCYYDLEILVLALLDCVLLLWVIYNISVFHVFLLCLSVCGLIVFVFILFSSIYS